MTRSTTVLRGACLALFVAAGLMAGSASAQPSGDRAIIVFDGSGSMWGQIDGRSKIEIARDTLDRVLGTLPSNLQLGMIAYGHTRKGDCGDIETLVDVGPAAATGRQIAQSVRRINPKGKTPLSDAVRRAAEALRYTEDKATVILVTDGIETCNADPCALASELERSGIDFTTHVVGFGLSDDEGRQVACLADNTGGLYLQAGNADELADALGKTVAVAPPPAAEPEPKDRPRHNFIGRIALAEGGAAIPEEAANGVAWHASPLDAADRPGARKLIGRGYRALWSAPSGRYLITIEYRLGGSVTHVVELDDYAVSEPVLPLNAARLTAHAVFMNDAFDIDWVKVAWRLHLVGTDKKRKENGYSLDVVLPAGAYRIGFGMSGEELDATEPQTLTLAAGATVPVDVIAPHSRVVLKAVEADGTRNQKIRQRFTPTGSDGTAGRKTVYDASPNPVHLRPGDYVGRVEFWDGTRRDPVDVPLAVGMGQDQVIDVPAP